MRLRVSLVEQKMFQTNDTEIFRKWMFTSLSNAGYLIGQLTQSDPSIFRENELGIIVNII